MDSKVVKKDKCIDMYLKIIKKNLEKELPEEGFDDDMFREANRITVELILHHYEAL